ncbi:MAG: hypothetical protein U0269_20150 [Polyangiales bacterium]
MHFVRPLVALAAATLATLSSQPAHARWMPHFDLTGLVLESQAVVQATRVSTRAPSQYQRLETFRVTRAVTGSLRAGETVEVETFLYNTQSLQPAISNEAVLFLQRADSAQGGGWQVVSSGYRVSSAGRAYRFVQFNNPGGFDAVPQGADPDDVRSPTATSAALSWSALLTALDAAVVRANQLRALEAQGAAAPRASLLALLGPAPDPAALMLQERSGPGFYRDVVGDRVAQLFAARRDAAGVMMVAVRSQGDEEGYAPVPALPSAALWALIDDASQPAELRAAALRSVESTGLLTPANAQRISTHLRDASALVRLAAARELMRRRDGFSSERGDAARLRAVRATVDRALLEYVQRESDPVARYALFIAGLSTPSPLGSRAPREALFAVARGRVLQIGVAFRSANGQTPAVSSVDFTLTRPGAAPIACGAQTAAATQSTSGASRWSVALRCERATAGPYAARAVITVDHAGPNRTRAVELGTIQW